MSERTLVFLKPEAVARGLIGEILMRIERKDLCIAAMKLMQMSREQAEKLYEMHRGKKFYEELIKHVTSSPVLAVVVEGPNAIKVLRKLAGATDPTEAEAGTIRGDYALQVTPNVIHAADSQENASREIPIFFSQKEILSYRK